MARPPKGGYTIYVCTHCKYSGRENLYATVSVKRGTKPKCPQCGHTDLEEEDRHHRFLRVATVRGRKAMEDILEIAALANSNYKWEPSEVESLFKALHSELDKAKKQFEKQPPPEVKFVL